MDVFWNRQSVFSQVKSVLIFSLTCSFIRIRPISNKGCSRKTKERYPDWSFNFTFRDIDYVLSLSNSTFDDFIGRIYPYELEIKDTTDTARCAWHLDLHFEIDSEDRFKTQLYETRDDFNFPIVNFPFIFSTIPVALSYGVCISQLMRYSRAWVSNRNFFDREVLLTRMLLNQGFLLVKFNSSLRKYVPKVVGTSWSFPHSCLITRFVTWVTRRVPLV